MNSNRMSVLTSGQPDCSVAPYKPSIKPEGQSMNHPCCHKGKTQGNINVIQVTLFILLEVDGPFDRSRGTDTNVKRINDRLPEVFLECFLPESAQINAVKRVLIPKNHYSNLTLQYWN